MLSLEQALDQILQHVGRLPVEKARIGEAFNRILAEPAYARCDLPAFDNSAMDGYAVRADDVAQASTSRPVALRIVGEIPAGETLQRPIHSGACARIFTGSPLPSGADAVVMQEDTALDATQPGVVLVTDKVRPFENVRLRGEEIKAGAEILAAGNKLNAGKIGLLGAVGVDQLQVSKRPLVALVATGSELLEPGAELIAGRIFESNRRMLAAALSGAGAEARVLPLVPDTLQATRDALESAFDQADAVVTSGGVSVGEYDLVRRVFEEIGGQLTFWKVAVKPGKPFVFGRLREKLFFGLPGNPVSAFVTFMLLVRPALLRWQGASDILLARRSGVLGERLVNRGERRHFMCVRLGENNRLYSSGLQASHAIMALARADGFVDVPPKTTLESGTAVDVLQCE